MCSSNIFQSLYDRVQQFWILPDMRQWDAGLETIVVLTILRDGTVARTMVEKKSTDPFFDQFVMKTIQSASPMPRFPQTDARNHRSRSGSGSGRANC